MVSRNWRVILTSVVIACFSTISFAASQKVLYSFTARRGDGAVPLAGVVFDSAGNLYGTTTGGGSDGDGIAFELSPMPDGEWAETVLHNFNWTDGAHPEANLIFDSSGNLYGTTVYGGANGQGTVFELSPAEGGGWTEQVLHSFGEAFDGVQPHAPLIFDSSGNLYGTTAGHRGNYGSAFELSPAIDGSWTETTLCDFPVTLGGKENGWHPYGGLVFDAEGNLYGTTSGGGHRGSGSVFELTPSQDGTWTETLLASLTYDHGDGPLAGLIFDAEGNLYGTASMGGASDAGTIFKVSPASGGQWMLRDIYNFSFVNGYLPAAALVMDAAGNMYGTTEFGGTNNNSTGTVFELTPNKGGGWTEGYISLTGEPNAGYPTSSLVFDNKGHAYGTTSGGGTYDEGTVFEIIR